MSSMDTGAPLLNDYKLEFFYKRFTQTLLGGLQLCFGYDVPLYVYLNQILVFLSPVVFGGVFTVLSEYQILTSLVGCYAYGCLVTCLVFTANLAVWFTNRRYTNVSKVQPNLFAEEDEVEFESCCDLETFKFIFTSKKSLVRIVVHGILSGVLAAILYLYLLPSTLNALYSSTGVTVLLYVFGWLTVCAAQYSLVASPPPEPATFRPQLWIDLTPFMRPFYALLFGITGLIAGSYPELKLMDQVLHATFPFLLFFWICGTLPPLDALFPWLAEQILVFGLGGSPMATDLRLVIMLVVSTIPAVLSVFISNHSAVVIMSCIFGNILSLNLFSAAAALIKPKITGTDTSATASVVPHWSLKEALVTRMMVYLAIPCAAVGVYFSDKATLLMIQGFGIVFCVLLIMLKLLADLQGVYIFWIIRNPLYPRSIQSRSAFDKRKRKIHFMAQLYHILLCYVCPLVMVAFIALFLQPHSSTGFLAIMSAIGIVRILRQVWQNTFSCLLDLCIVCIIDAILIGHTAEWWTNTGLSVQLICISICRDRIQQLLQKLLFQLTLTITSLSLKKQHHKATTPIIITSIFLIPVVLAVTVTSTVLSSPLLPLFCLPLFIIGFPRPLRSWPRTGDITTSLGHDSVYYQQLTPKVITSLSQSLATGALGNRQPGDHFILRYQDRLVWVHVVESGYRYCFLVIKGLEMQETSCHTLEAARVDEIFEAAFIRDEQQSIFYRNPYPWNTLTPCDVVTLDSYSDARNVLTGVIDQPENLRKVSENLLKTLLWVLINNCKNSSAKTPQMAENNDVQKREQTEENANFARTIVRTKCVEVSSHEAVLPRSDSLPSINGSLWSQDSFQMDGNDSYNKIRSKRQEKDTESLNSFEQELAELSGFGTRKPKTPDDPFKLGGFPALDTGKPVTKATVSMETTQVGIHKAQFVSGQTSFVDTPFSCKSSYQVDMPSRWKTNLPVEEKLLRSLSSSFPVSWYQHILSSLLTGDDGESIATDSVLRACYERLVLTCYALVEVLGYPGSSSHSAGPVHPFKVCNGEIPWSLHSEWLQNDKELMALVLKAYRFAFKLMYDEAVLGEVTSHEELTEYLTEYNNDWYMGQDTDEHWGQAVLDCKPYLFSLGRNKNDGTYTSRILTRQSILAPVGRLNGEAVRGHWASLAFELLYLTNDDEERYSIQAHPVLLRNLTIQAADPPLGYPVYSSGLVSVPVRISPL